MYIQRLALRGDKFAGSVPREPSGRSVFMFGTCDQADADLGRCNPRPQRGDPRHPGRTIGRSLPGAAAIPKRRACHNSNAFMSCASSGATEIHTAGELPLCLRASGLD